jgi:TetR/AcrR family transcriptional repressor of nem operon
MSRGVDAGSRTKRKKHAAAPPPPRARAETKQETREALIRAGAELFAAQGIDVPSLDALCAHAGYTRGAFYVHFRDREDFVAAVMEGVTGRFLDAILAGRGDDADLGGAIAAFASAVSGGAPAIFGEVPLHQLLAACARSPALRERYAGLVQAAGERFAAAVRAGQRAGRVRGDVDEGHVARILVALALGVGTMIELGAPFDASAHAAVVTKLLERRR